MASAVTSASNVGVGHCTVTTLVTTSWFRGMLLRRSGAGVTAGAAGPRLELSSSCDAEGVTQGPRDVALRVSVVL